MTISKNITLENLPDTIIKRRQELGLNQKELSEKLGIKQSHLSRIEAGDLTVNMGTFFKICNALELEINAVFVAAGILQNALLLES